MSKVFVSLGMSLDGFPPAHANQRCTSAERSEEVDHERRARVCGKHRCQPP